MYITLFDHQDAYLGLVHHREQNDWSFELTPQGEYLIQGEVSAIKNNDLQAFMAWSIQHRLKAIFLEDQALSHVEKILQSPLKTTEKQALLKLLGQTPEPLLKEWEQVLE